MGFKHRKILYVEDDALSRDLMSVIMERVMEVGEYRIFKQTDNFKQYLDELNEPVDMILLDIYMEPEDGYSLLEGIRAHPMHKDSLVVALTASVMKEDIDILRTKGFNGVIGKPIEVTTFPSLLESIFNGESVWFIS